MKLYIVSKARQFRAWGDTAFTLVTIMLSSDHNVRTTEWRKTINAHPVHTGSTHTVHSIKTQPSTESYLEHYSKQDIKKLKKSMVKLRRTHDAPVIQLPTHCHILHIHMLHTINRFALSVNRTALLDDHLVAQSSTYCATISIWYSLCRMLRHDWRSCLERSSCLRHFSTFSVHFPKTFKIASFSTLPSWPCLLSHFFALCGPCLLLRPP